MRDAGYVRLDTHEALKTELAAMKAQRDEAFDFLRDYIRSGDMCIRGFNENPCECVACSLTRDAKALIAKVTP